MSNIELSKSKHELIIIDEILQHLFKEHNLDYHLGDLFWSSTYGMGILVDVTFVNPDETGEKRFETNNINLHFHYYNNEHYKDRPYKYTLRDYLYYQSSFKVETETEEQFDKDLTALSNGELSMEELISTRFGKEVEESKSTELMTMNKDVLVQRKKELIQQQNFAAARAKAVANILEQRKNQLAEVSANLKKFIGKITRLIWSIELYLGIKEELVQIGVGMNAPAEDPICFRQRLLYMDVEMGDPTDDWKGIDISNVEDFDNWLLKYNPYWKQENYKLLIPESKCVVIFRVRRDEKKYVDNPWINTLMNGENFLTYILIRNGDNLYRVYADITMGEKLFPDSDELEKLISQIDNERSSYDKEKAESKYERYKLNIILFQGIIERTVCFPEEQNTVSLFNPDSYQDKVKFIYDATLSKQLPTHVLPFTEWQKKINLDIEEGSRILFIKRLLGWLKAEDRQWYLFKANYWKEYNTPREPNTGIYQVYFDAKHTRRYSSEDGTLYIKYNPEDSLGWDSDYNDIIRKNRLAWSINREEDHIINYDAIDRKTISTLEFYMYTRIGRENYLTSMPILMDLLKRKQEEIAIEDEFIKLALTNAGLDPDTHFAKGEEALEHWKVKNKWKRALNSDDAKALRMITKSLKKK